MAYFQRGVSRGSEEVCSNNEAKKQKQISLDEGLCKEVCQKETHGIYEVSQDAALQRLWGVY